MTIMKRLTTILMMLILAAAFVLPAPAFAEDDAGKAAQEPAKETAQDAGRTVRVGWYASPFNTIDQFGRRSGYAYEYQRKIAAYTGWKYEYVEGSWPQLLEMLKKGEIDLMSDVSYMEERTKDMLYTSLPMGTESYYVFVTPDKAETVASDYSVLNGKRVAVTKGSIQEELFLDWEKTHDVNVKLIELTGSEDEALERMANGEFDAVITVDIYGSPDTAVPACKVGASDYFFVVNKTRPDLLNELDAALNAIQDENRYYNQQLYERFLNNGNNSKYLSPQEQKWVDKHGPIRVGYQDNYLAFCASDPQTGELTGALKDYLEYASNALENTHLDFEAVAYPTAQEAIEAVQKGEVDCMFPANLSAFDGESLGVVMTPALMRTEMDAVVRESAQKEFIKKKDVVVCVNKGNTNYEMFLQENYPGWKIAYYPDTPAGLEAIAAGEADCVIISNYRFSNIEKQCENLHLTTVYTGVGMDYYLAVREGETQLYSILTKVIDTVPESVTNASLTYYSTEDVKTGLLDDLMDHLGAVMSVIALVLAIIIVLLLLSIRMGKKARKEHHLVEDLNKQVFVDALTHVRNKGAFDEYIQGMQEKLDEAASEADAFAIGVFDCDNLKKVNDGFGHDKGDEYLKGASRLICRIFQHSPVFRIGGDEFAVILQNEDFENREALVKEFYEAQKDIYAQAENQWDEVHVSVGIAVYDPDIDESISDTVRRADKIMYQNKQDAKEGQ